MFSYMFYVHICLYMGICVYAQVHILNVCCVTPSFLSMFCFQYEKAAAILQTNEPPIILAKVDASEEQNKGLATEFDVQGYPTLKIIRDRGAHIHGYKGPRDADGIVSYMKRQVGPPSEEIISAEQAQKLIEDKDIVIVCYLFSIHSHTHSHEPHCT